MRIDTAFAPDGTRLVTTTDLPDFYGWDHEVQSIHPEFIDRIVVNDDGSVGLATYYGTTLTGEIGSALGSSLGRLLGGNSLIGKVAAGTVIGTIGKEIGNALTYGGTYTLDVAVKDAFGTLGGGTTVGALPTAAIGAVTSLLIAELADALHLHGIEGGLFTTAGTTITTQLVTNAFGMMTGATWGPDNLPYTMFTGFDPLAMVTNLGGAVAGYFGATLAGHVMVPHYAEGAIGQQVGTTVGGAIGAFLLAGIPVVGPIVGSFLGSFLGGVAGAFLGDLAGQDPEAHGRLVFNTDHHFYPDPTSFWGDHGGDGETFLHMATYTAFTVNALADFAGVTMDATPVTTAHHVLPMTGLQLRYGQDTHDFWINDQTGSFLALVQNVDDDSDIAPLVDAGIMGLTDRVTITGGDPLVRFAWANSTATTPSGFALDLQAAKDYRAYLDDKDMIDLMMAAAPESAFTAGWVLTLLKARELGLDALPANDDFRSGNDVFYGTEGADSLVGGPGGDNLLAGAGNDRLNGGADGDWLDGGAGNDILIGGTGGDIMIGGPGDDIYSVDSGGDWMSELAGGGTDTVYASLGIVLMAEVDNLTLLDAAGAGTAAGNAIANILTGNASDNVLDGGDGSDTLIGGAGNDNLIGGRGADFYNGGAGNDWANYYWLQLVTWSSASEGVTVDLANPGRNTGAAAGDSYAGIEWIYGTAFGDSLTGNNADNRIEGDAGNDDLTGGGGNDTLNGGGGNDVARYGGARAQYQVRWSPDGLIRVTDLRAGAPEGTDALYGVESLQFADGLRGFHDPVITGHDNVMLHGEARSASWLFSASDADGDALTYWFMDATPGASTGHFEFNGVVQADNQWFSVPAAQHAQLTYRAGAAGSVDHIRLIADDEVGFRGEGSLTVTTAYAAFAQPTFALADFGTLAAAGGWTDANTYPRALADVNGDGMADIVGFASNGVNVSLATGNGHFAPRAAELGYFGTNAGYWADANTYPRVLADVTGDGMADIVGFASGGVVVSRATGGGHFADATYELAFFAPNAGYWTNANIFPRTLADVNGDHMADIVGFASSGVVVSLATGNGHFGQPTVTLADYGTLASAGGWTDANTYPRALADVNGDGMADIVGFASNGVNVSLATGGGSFAPRVGVLGAFGTGSGWSDANTYPRSVADVNGDGMADIIGFGSGGVNVSLATGGGHFADPTYELAYFSVGAGGWTNANTYPRTLADVTGDGSADIVGFASTGTVVALSHLFMLH